MPLSATDKVVLERIENGFNAPHNQAVNYHKLRQAAKALAVIMVDLCPDGGDRALALARLEEAFMWAVAANERQREAS